MATLGQWPEVATQTSDRRRRLVPNERCVSAEEPVDLLTFVTSTRQVIGGRRRIAPGPIRGRQADDPAYGAAHPSMP